MMADDGVGRPRIGGQHGLHAIDLRRHDGQAVGPALFVAEVDRGQQIVGGFVNAGRNGGHPLNSSIRA